MTVCGLGGMLLVPVALSFLANAFSFLVYAVSILALPLIMIAVGISIVIVALVVATTFADSGGGASVSLTFVATLAGMIFLCGAFAIGGRLLVRAMDYEVSDNVRHSPNGGYYEP